MGGNTIGQSPWRATMLFISLSSMSSLASARDWTQVDTFHPVIPEDNTFTVAEISLEADGLFFTDAPSSSPSLSPTMTRAPSYSPAPVEQPSESPSGFPSQSPSVSPAPSDSPSSAPSPDPYPLNPVPSNPPVDYFNYDPSSQYGPDNWGNQWRTPDADDYYWTEFTDQGFGSWQGAFDRRQLDRNRCDSNFLQSPINVERSFNGTHYSSCRGFGHQILAGWGDFDLDSSNVKKRIEPNKLRLIYDRRACFRNLPECDSPEPAYGDFPNGWGGKADVLHVDFKYPSEHWVNGKAYDAEMQVFHGHVPRARMPTSSSVIKAVDGVHNREFQFALDEFQAVFDQHAAECEANKRRERRKLARAHELLKGNGLWNSIVDYASSWKYSLWTEAPETANATRTRRLRANWYPYHPLLTPSPYFYAYAGSMTEPPCTEMVNWRICRRPMLIGYDQLEQLKSLIFLHVNGNCERTSVHHDRSVARPIQPTNSRTVVACSSFNYEPSYNLFPPGLGDASYDLTLPLI